MTPEFSDEQVAVIESDADILVVTGGAGCGKTTAAVAAAHRHLQEHVSAEVAVRNSRTGKPLISNRVLFVSFSRASAARIMERSAPLIGEYGHLMEVTTFHSLAWRIVARFGSLVDLPSPVLLTSAQSKHYNVPKALQYKDLVPTALKLAKLPVVSSYLQKRWSLIICDEYQDTDEWQNELLRLVRGGARLVLLGDPNQCIYSDLPDVVGVSPARIETAGMNVGAETIELPPASHRDPSGVIPAMAAAIRKRDFSGPAIEAAIGSGRFQVRYFSDLSQEAEQVELIVKQLRDEGLGVAVFSHHVDALAALSDQLRDAGMKHDVMGLSESLSSALEAQQRMVEFSIGVSQWIDVRRYLAFFVTSSVRGRRVPQLAVQLRDGTGGSSLQSQMEGLRSTLTSSQLDEAFAIARDAHARLGLPNKEDAWIRAADMLLTMRATATRMIGLRETPPRLLAVIDQLATNARMAMLTEEDVGSYEHVQLMGLYQTKGREADATVVILRSNDFFGTESSEPFEVASRLLYVVFSRARKKVVLLIFGDGHGPLIAPFVRLAV